MGKIMHISSRQVTESTSLCTQYISPWIFRTAAVRPLPQGGEHQHQSTEVSYSAPAISSSNSSSRFATMNRISSTIGVTPRPSVRPRWIGDCRWNLPPRGSYTIKLSRTLHRPRGTHIVLMPGPVVPSGGVVSILVSRRAASRPSTMRHWRSCRR